MGRTPLNADLEIQLRSLGKRKYNTPKGRFTALFIHEHTTNKQERQVDLACSKTILKHSKHSSNLNLERIIFSFDKTIGYVMS